MLLNSSRFLFTKAILTVVTNVGVLIRYLAHVHGGIIGTAKEATELDLVLIRPLIQELNGTVQTFDPIRLNGNQKADEMIGINRTVLRQTYLRVPNAFQRRPLDLAQICGTHTENKCIFCRYMLEPKKPTVDLRSE